jgi:threonine synthase
MPESQKSVMPIHCAVCGNVSKLSLENWCCERCGGPWLPSAGKRLEPADILASSRDIWRYARWMGLNLDEPVRLGAGGTPLLAAHVQGHPLYLKVEYQQPTGSFKDRGVEVMVSALRQLGAQRVAEDSSGNAGASLAAYAAHADLQAEVFAPDSASMVKLAQMELYGARVNRVPGPRENSTRAVLAAVAGGAAYASHAWNPAYLLGQQTAAWEVWEQLNRRAPDWWVTPAGQGGHLLGIWMGFQRLLESGLIERLPRMVLVQAERMAPLASAMHQRKVQLAPRAAVGRSMAEGVAVSSPVRWQQILAGASSNHWLGFSIPEEEILPARQELARGGFFVEPTSALAAAALPRLFPLARPDDVIVVSLTGSGLKVPMTS